MLAVGGGPDVTVALAGHFDFVHVRSIAPAYLGCHGERGDVIFCNRDVAGGGHVETAVIDHYGGVEIERVFPLPAQQHGGLLLFGAGARPGLSLQTGSDAECYLVRVKGLPALCHLHLRAG